MRRRPPHENPVALEPGRDVLGATSGSKPGGLTRFCRDTEGPTGAGCPRCDRLWDRPARRAPGVSNRRRNHHGVWTRPDVGFRAEEVVAGLRDAYRLSQFACKRMAPTAGPRAEAPAPLLSIELPTRTAILRRVRGQIIACLFDASMPIGMARFVSARVAQRLDPELPRNDGPDNKRPRPSSEARNIPAAQTAPSNDTPPPESRQPTVAPKTERRSRSPTPQDRVRTLVAYVEAHAPDPHVVRQRLALRAGLTLAGPRPSRGLGRRGHCSCRGSGARHPRHRSHRAKEDRVTS